MITHDKIEPVLEAHDVDLVIASTAEHVLYTSGMRPSTTVTPHAESFEQTGFYYDSPPTPPKYLSLWSLTEGGPILVIPPVSATELVDRSIDAKDTFVYAPEGYMINHAEKLSDEDRFIVDTLATTYGSIYEALEVALASLGGGVDTVAIESLSLSSTDRAHVENAIDAGLDGDVDVVEATTLFHELRTTKTSEEIARLRRATEANERAILAAIEEAEAGITEREFAAIFRERQAREGAKPGHTNIGFGEHTSYVHVIPGDNQLAPGDLIRFEVGLEYDDYPADLARTFAFRSASDAAKRQYEVLSAVIQEAASAMRPGMHTGELHDTAMDRGRERAGELGVDELTDWTRRHIGHNMGIDIHDHPLLSPAMAEYGNDVLEPGMVINYEVSYATLGRFGVQIEDTALITDDGIEPFCQAPESLPVIG